MLYTLDVAFRAQLTSGRALASLSCLDGAGETLALASSEPPIAADPTSLRIATWCPPGTSQLRLDLDDRGTGAVTFLAVQLRVLPARAP